MQVTIVYDNEVLRDELISGWGFSALIQGEGIPTMLFDTGGDSFTLLHNMAELGIDSEKLEVVVISHPHSDHTGGLSEILRRNPSTELYVTKSFREKGVGGKITVVDKATEICKDIFSTGELSGMEQSLVLRSDYGVFVLTGCSHPGPARILSAASKFGKLYGIAGGFGHHDPKQFRSFPALSLIYPCHCSAYKREMIKMFPDKVVECGVGLRINL
ncbi:MAG: MBL fold metallo-hydrolase [Dehalococcoidia bacterium]|nr:MBL fold metallo-hydrolase [Dehalococcoidia bacterium]